MSLLRVLGLATVFGVDVVPADPVPVLVGAAVAAVLLALCNATIATAPMVRCPPGRLFE